MTSLFLLVLGVSCLEKDTGEIPTKTSDIDTGLDTDTDVNQPLEIYTSDVDAKISGVMVEECIGWGIATGDFNNDLKDDISIQSWQNITFFNGPLNGEYVSTEADVLIDFNAFETINSGDYNGDRIADLIIAAYSHPYLVQGPITSSVDLDLQIQFEGDNVYSGALKDIDNNGYDDLVLNSRDLSYLFYGMVSSENIEDADAVVVPELPDYLDTYLVNDVNGDGIGDIVSNVSSDAWDFQKPCTAYVMYGLIYGITNLSDSDVIISSSKDNGWLGEAVSGDVTGDGYYDLITTNRVSEVFIIEGPVVGQYEFSQISTVYQGEGLGESIGLGNLDDDSADELVVTSIDLNKVYIIYEVEEGISDILKSDIIIQGQTENHSFGSSVSLGDVDGDLLTDIFIADRSETSEYTGAVYLIYGSTLETWMHF